MKKGMLIFILENEDKDIIRQGLRKQKHRGGDIVKTN